MKFRCNTHKIEVEIRNNTRRYSNLSWGGSPQCQLFTMREPKEGKYRGCKIVEVK